MLSWPSLLTANCEKKEFILYLSICAWICIYIRYICVCVCIYIYICIIFVFVFAPPAHLMQLDLLTASNNALLWKISVFLYLSICAWICICICIIYTLVFVFAPLAHLMQFDFLTASNNALLWNISVFYVWILVFVFAFVFIFVSYTDLYLCLPHGYI